MSTPLGPSAFPKVTVWIPAFDLSREFYRFLHRYMVHSDCVAAALTEGKSAGEAMEYAQTMLEIDEVLE